MSGCRKYVDYIMEQVKNLLAIGSPSGYDREVTGHLSRELEASGVQTRRTVKGSATADFGGKNKEDGILLEIHCDILGGMVAQVKKNGRLKLVNIGGMKSANAEAENVHIITKVGGIYGGTCRLVDASVYVNDSYEKTECTWDTMEVLVDEDAMCRESVVKLGIIFGDYVCFEPRTRTTPSGYIKSHFLDDKLSAAILMDYAKCFKDESVTLEHRVYAHFTIHEEAGHGGSTSVPEDVTEAWSADMGCVGEGLQCTERGVSICTKDSDGPYNYDILCHPMELAKEHGTGYAVDVYPHYGSDVETTLKSGRDMRHVLTEPGVYTPHGYEGSHRDGAENIFRLIQACIG